MLSRIARHRFVELIRSLDARTDLAEVALVVAAETTPGLDIEAYLHRLDAMAEEADRRTITAAEPRQRIETLNRYLFEDLGFIGDDDDYYNPRNSFLNEVLDRRAGIPVTLALVYLSLTRRLGWPVVGVGFPAHFLVKYTQPQILVDPFTGEVINKRECRRRLRIALGDSAEWREDYLDPAAPVDIVLRLLTNLKHIYIQSQRHELALSCCERLLLLLPDSPKELRDRGLVLLELECRDEAYADFERFLELAPEDPAAEAVRDVLSMARQQIPLVN